MRSTQINGETFVCAVDVVEWMRAGMTNNPSHAASVILAVAEILEKWANDPERKIGIPNVTMPQITK